MSNKIAFLGAGNMGASILSALLAKQVVAPEELSVCDKSAEKLKIFSQQRITVSQNAEEILSDAKFVFLAIKPQDSGDFLTTLSGSFDPQTVLVSIAAGLNMSFLKKKSGLQKIVRVMPNTPAMVHMGVSGMHVSEDVSPEEKSFVHTLLESFSTVIMCESEDKIDAITALSGSGPAYFFRILEIFSQKAQELGFSKEESDSIALETLRGAGTLVSLSGEEFSVLRKKVTSKGGTTEAALKVFEEKKLEEILNAGIDAAVERAKELGDVH